MANYFTDNEDLRWYLEEGIDWQPIVDACELGFRSPDGFRSVDEDLNGDWTEIQSGTSIATAVVSASMANAWAGLAGTDPDISAAAVVDAVYAASPVMVEDATYATSGIPNGACDALAYLSGSPAPYTPSNDNVAANFEIGYPEGYIPSAKAALSHVITGCSAVAAVTGTIPTGCIGEASLQAQCDAEAGFDAAAVEVESSTEPGVGIVTALVAYQLTIISHADGGRRCNPSQRLIRLKVEIDPGQHAQKTENHCQHEGEQYS